MGSDTGQGWRGSQASDEAAGLDELAAPPVIDPKAGNRDTLESEEQSEQERHLSRDTGQGWRGSQASDEAAGLDELAAPQVIDPKAGNGDTLESEEQSEEENRHRHGPQHSTGEGQASDLEASSDHEKGRFRASGPSTYFHERCGTLAMPAWIIFFSIWAVLARLGLNALEDYNGRMIFPLIWSQFIGCLVMGFANEVKGQSTLDDHSLAFFVGVTTGFCGSLTSFASWMLDCFYAIANLNQFYPRPRGYNVLSFLTQIIVTLVLSIGALRLGAEIGIFALWLSPSSPKVRSVWGGRKMSYFSLLAIALAVLVWVGVVFLIAFVPAWRGSVTFPAFFGPFGALARWYLARFNPRFKGFPIGTFLANVIGTVLLCIFVLLQYRVDAGRVGCDVLLGLQNGLCGALSTVSTFVIELVSLKRRHAWTYGSVSVVLGVVITVLMLGIDAWTTVWQTHCAVT